jgi:hypothetical protein
MEYYSPYNRNKILIYKLFSCISHSSKMSIRCRTLTGYGLLSIEKPYRCQNKILQSKTPITNSTDYISKILFDVLKTKTNRFSHQ